MSPPVHWCLSGGPYAAHSPCTFCSTPAGCSGKTGSVELYLFVKQHTRRCARRATCLSWIWANQKVSHNSARGGLELLRRDSVQKQRSWNASPDSVSLSFLFWLPSVNSGCRYSLPLFYLQAYCWSLWSCSGMNVVQQHLITGFNCNGTLLFMLLAWATPLRFPYRKNDHPAQKYSCTSWPLY